MKKFNVHLARFRSKITLFEPVLIVIIASIIFIPSIVVLSRTDNFVSFFIMLLLYIFWIFISVFFLSIAFNRSVDNKIKKYKAESLKTINLMLHDYYTLVLYEPENSQNDELTLLCIDALFKKNLKFYAKLNEDNSINISVRDSNGKIISEISTKKYRYFLENFRICTFI